MTNRLALALAILYPSLISAAINLGRERPITPPALDAASGHQRDVSVATSGAETLVAWIDTTRGRTGAYVAVLSPDAELIEGSQRWLAPNASDVTITWTGREYLALWSAGGLVASTLDRDGATVVPPRHVLPGVTSVSDVAWVGSTGMLLCKRHDRVQATIVDQQGNVTQADVAISSSRVHDARVVSDGTSFYIFWRVRKPGPEHLIDLLFVARFGVDGRPQAVTPDPLWTGTRLLDGWDVAFDGQHFALVLSQRSGETDTTLHRFLVDAATLLPTTLDPVDLGTAGAASVEWTDTQFLVFWMHRVSGTTHELRTLDFSAPGAPVRVLGPFYPLVDSDSVWNGRALVVAWTTQNETLSDLDVLATTVHGGHQKRIAVSSSYRWQALAASATNGNESLLVWLEGGVANEGPRRIVSAHATGGVIDQAPHHHSETPFERQPVVIFTGTMYLLVFNENTPNYAPRIALRRIDARGIPLDPAPIHVAYGLGFGAAWNGRHLLVAYQTVGNIHAVRIAQNGAIVDPVPSTLLTGVVDTTMSVASNGTDFLLAGTQGWNDARAGDVYAIAISWAGKAMGAPIDVATGPASQRLPVVASDGRDYAIVYTQDQTLAVKKVLREGTLANTVAQASGTLIAQNPFPWSPYAIAATPAGYMVAWERHDPSDFTSHVGELWLAPLDRNATLADDPRPVVRSALYQMYPTLVPAGGGALDLAYSRLVYDSSYGASMRIFLRRIEEGAAGRRRSVRH